ncbi:hypothetical protein SPB21_04025 [Leptothoe sp. ISB3NOV94-8A]
MQTAIQPTPNNQSIQTQLPPAVTHVTPTPVSQSGDLNTFIVVVAVTVLAKVLLGRSEK